MRTEKRITETEHVHRLFENLIIHLAKGREWATPGVHVALQKAMAGLDTGIETASPRLQAVLRLLTDDLAGGVGTLTPRVQEPLKRVGPKAAAAAAESVRLDETRRLAMGKWWWIGGLLAIAAAGVGVWRSLQTSRDKPWPPLTVQETGGADSDADPDLASGRI